MCPTHVSTVIGAHSHIASLIVLPVRGPASLQLMVGLLVGRAGEAVIGVAL